MSSDTGYMLLAMIIFLVFLYSLAWVYQDAQARGRTGCMWLLIAWFTWPLGVLAYYILRDKQVQL